MWDATISMNHFYWRRFERQRKRGVVHERIGCCSPRLPPTRQLRPDACNVVRRVPSRGMCKGGDNCICRRGRASFEHSDNHQYRVHTPLVIKRPHVGSPLACRVQVYVKLLSTRIDQSECCRDGIAVLRRDPQQALAPMCQWAESLHTSRPAAAPGAARGFRN